MTDILLSLILVLFVGFGTWGYLRLRTLKRQIEDFITPPADNQPSPLANVVQASADIIARSVVMQAKATFMGSQSAANRAVNAIEGDIAEDVLTAKSPLLGGLLSSFPTLRKTLRRNPGLVDLALSAMSKIQPGVSSGGNGSSSTQTKFKL